MGHGQLRGQGAGAALGVAINQELRSTIDSLSEQAPINPDARALPCSIPALSLPVPSLSLAFALYKPRRVWWLIKAALYRGFYFMLC